MSAERIDFDMELLEKQEEDNKRVTFAFIFNNLKAD
jgi:hypothetical protein